MPYSWFLIDTQMSACMLTSRIKQAISSVQLFVQRVPAESGKRCAVIAERCGRSLEHVDETVSCLGSQPADLPLS